MLRTSRLLFFIFLVGGIFWAARPSAAANCYFFSEAVGFVCNAEALPPTFVTPQPIANSFLPRTTYVRVLHYADVYAGPTAAGGPVRNMGRGYFFFPLLNMVDAEGSRWYEILPGQWIKKDYILVVPMSQFQGVEIHRQPERPFGWILQSAQPSSEPGGEPNPDFAVMQRYDFFQIYDAAKGDDDWIWYRVSRDTDRWVRQTHVSVIDAKPRPAEVGADEYWVEVDLYEQNFAAYEGDRIVYAGLISSGLNRWPTYEGIFQVWDRWVKQKMSGAEGKIDYYYIQDVPYIMYFDEYNQIALHGAFWHDRLGYKQSHGCVNMAPYDAEWVFHWSSRAANDLWVWVHTSDPNHYFDRYK
jgi:hypothetical protein